MCKLRIWADNDGLLFERLKRAARSFLAAIADLCEKRFIALGAEPGGQELLMFCPDPTSTNGLVVPRRQDHPEVGICREVEASAKITYQQSVCSQVRAIVIHEEARREAHLEREGCVSPFLRILPATDFFTSFQVFILLFPMSDFYSQDSIRNVYIINTNLKLEAIFYLVNS